MTIIDVRGLQEYKSGHADNSINIPLQDVSIRLEEIRKFTEPIILCCASGNRSGQAVDFLTSQGIVCENAGAWQDVINYIKHIIK